MPESESSEELAPKTVPCSRSETALLIKAVMPVLTSAMPNEKRIIVTLRIAMS